MAQKKQDQEQAQGSVSDAKAPEEGEVAADDQAEQGAAETQEEAAPEPKSQKQLLADAARIDERIREAKLDRLIEMADQAKAQRRR